MPIAGVRISDMIASGRNGVRAYNTSGLELFNVQVNAERGPAFMFRDAADLELSGVTSRQPLASLPVIRLDKTPGAIVRNSKAFTGTGTFLSVGAGELKSLTLDGNAISRAKKPIEESATDYWGMPPASRTTAAAPRAKK